MVALTWGEQANRKYGAGIDKGVFYPASGAAGVAWNGLISVEENSSGGDAEEYFIDGMKYLDFVPSQPFEATIEAFSAPNAFNECEGMAVRGTGLYLANQPRQTFGMCYRKRIGNGVNALNNSEYEIHLVYGATVLPYSRSTRTLTDTAEPEVRQWSIRAVPPSATTYRATAHLVLKSIEINPTKLASIEGSLYGSVSGNPTLLSQDFLISFLV